MAHCNLNDAKANLLLQQHMMLIADVFCCRHISNADTCFIYIFFIPPEPGLGASFPPNSSHFSFFFFIYFPMRFLDPPA